MSVRLEAEVVHLEGDCGVEDAEPLLVLLQADRFRTVDLDRVDRLHTAVFQVLFALRPPLQGQSPDLFVRERLLPILS
ncbi:hypothetical protein [Microvirga pudoricolor]|uniref:hypothetical protein n=1 Tax=Microvirga pudoricolor TaxID=2778729 RepID=UPI0019511121|nr:hypothetical protein [Microvirga pudoricolor]MBM6595236.1 hypothetical protein [Microvirga pudoricolor]